MQKRGFGIGQNNCSNPSSARLISYANITNGSLTFFHLYIIKRQIKYSSLGKPYMLFTYSTGMVDQNLMLYKFGSAT